MASHYQYQPLAKGTQIRLLEIQPLRVTTRSPFSLQTYDLSHLPPYEAISYTWGSSEFDKSITCDGRRLPITTNCATMLHYLRLETVWARRVWIDQICVNQKDIPERNDQVLRMTDIYSRAQQVVAWIGECSEREKRCLELIAKFDYDSVRHIPIKVLMRIQEGTNEAPGAHPELNMLLDGDGWVQKTLGEILSRPYFRRIWIVQEVTVAQRVRLRCGECSLDIQYLFDVVRFTWKYPLSRLYSTKNALVLLECRLSYSGKSTLDADGVGAPFIWTQDYLAADLKDKVYALRGVCRNLRENMPPPDYSKLDVDVYLEVAKASNMTDQGRLTILSRQWSPRHGADLPTWCPDYGGPVVDNLLHLPVPSEMLREKSKRPNKLPIIDGRRLIVQGKVVDSLARVSERADPDWDDPSMTSDFDRWRSWLSFMEPAVSSYGEEPFHIAFWRTLFNDTPGRLRPQSVLEEERATGSLNYVEALHAALIEEQPDQEPYLSHWLDPELPYDVSNALWRTNRVRACITNEKFFGLVPEYAEIGDFLVYLQGAETLHLLRPQDRSKSIFTLVGMCYVHGLANGERYPSDDSELTEIVII